MANRTLSIGVRIEGVGDDSSKREGIVWYWGPRVNPPAGSDGEDYEWIGGHGSGQGLVRAPRAAALSVDIFTADIKTSPHDFELHADSVALGKFYSRQIASSIWLTSPLDKTSSPAVNTSPSAPVIFIGDEAIKQAGAPSSWTYTTRTQYFATGGRGIVAIDGTGQTDTLVIGASFGANSGSEDSHVKLAPITGAAATWTMDTTGMSTGAASRLVGMRATQSKVFVQWADEDGTFTANFRSVVQRLDIADGMPDWSFGTGNGTNTLGNGLAYAPGDQTVFTWVNDTGNELYAVDAIVGTKDGDTSDGGGNAASLGVTTDEQYVIAIKDNEELEAHAIPFVNGSVPTFTIDLTTDPTLSITSIERGTGEIDRSPVIVKDRTGTGCWICHGADAADTNTPYVWHLDPTTQAFDIEIDCTGDSPLGAAPTALHAGGVAVDQFGQLYVLLRDGDEADVCVYDSSGTFIKSFLTEGYTLPDVPDVVNPLSIGVTDNGDVGIGTENGWLYLYAAVSSGASGPLERGYWGTAAQDHSAYSRVYELNPHHLHRQATVLEYDHADGSVTPRWRGFINSDIKTSRDGTRLVLQCIELQAAIAQAVINNGAPELQLGSPDPGSSFLFGQSVGPGIVNNRAVGKIAPEEFRVRTKEVIGATNHWAAFQVSDGLVYGDFGVRNYDLVDDDQHINQTTIGSAPQLGSEFGDEIDPIYEVLAIDRERDTADGVLVAQTSRRSSTAQLTDPFHPVAISMALLQSSESLAVAGFDVFGAEWGLGLPDAFFDLAVINETITASGLAQIDHLVLGWDGEEVDAWTQIKSLCRTYGFFPSRSATGQLTFRRIRTANICEFANAVGLVAIPDTLEFQQARADSVAFLSGRFNVLPWNDGRPYRSVVLDANNANGPVPRLSKRRGLFAQRREQRFDMPTRKNIGELASDLLGIAKAKANQSPRLRLRVHDDGFAVGDFVRLADLNVQEAWLPLPDGTTTLLDPADVRWVGMVVGLNPDYERGRTELEMLLTNYSTGEAARTRAPNAEVASAVGSTYTCGNAIYTDGDDCLEFNIGDVLELWGPDFALRSGTPAAPDTVTITDLPAPKGTAAANTIVTDVAFTTAPSLYDVIRLAHLDDVNGYPENGLAQPCNGFLAYAYIATLGGELGPNALVAHIYG